MDPFFVEVMRSCRSPISLASVGWVANGGRANVQEERDTSEPACEKRKILSMKSSTSWFFLVAEILGHRERGEADAQAGARRLVHLAVDQRDLRLAEILLVNDASFGHFVVKIVAFAGALADAGEHGVARHGPWRCC